MKYPVFILSLILAALFTSCGRKNNFGEREPLTFSGDPETWRRQINGPNYKDELDQLRVEQAQEDVVRRLMWHRKNKGLLDALNKVW